MEARNFGRLRAVIWFFGFTIAAAQVQACACEVGAGRLLAQNAPTQPTAPSGNGGAASPPQPPSGPGATGGSLSRELSRSGGIIHPPASGDRGIVTPPPAQDTSRTPIIPPPGTPGGNPLVQPK